MLAIAWILSGIVSGLLTGKLLGAGQETSTDIVLGIVGGVLGGVAFHLLGPPHDAGVELWAILLPAIGAATMLGVYYAIVGRKEAT